MSSPVRRAAEAYVEHVNARDADALLGLFAADALLLAAGGQTLQGSEEIRAFYESAVFPPAPVVRAVRFIEQGDTCAMELEATTSAAPDLTAHLIDVLTVDAAGAITRLAIYMRL